MKTIIKTQLTFTLVFFALFFSISSDGCTGIKLTAKDGSVVFARTLEFANNLHSEILLIPRGMDFQGMTNDGSNGLKWTTKYACVGANFEGEPYLLDGLNEKGLAVGIFYFPGYADYQAIGSEDLNKTLNEWQLPNWILGNFETISEVKTALKDVKVVSAIFKKWGFVLPMHYIVSDTKGDAIVIEYVNGELNIYDNPLGVITNSPTFDWHITNIRNYLNLSANDVNKKEFAGETFTPFGQGSGLFGIPGDFTPPSRFIRALFFSLSSIDTNTSEETILQAFHILNSFDIPKGSVRESSGSVAECDYTQWTAAKDLSGKKYYFITEGNARKRVVDLLKCDLDAKTIKKINMESPEDFLDITNELK